jgi:hypothetical protein
LSVFIADSTTLLTKAVSSKCCQICLCPSRCNGFFFFCCRIEQCNFRRQRRS